MENKETKTASSPAKTSGVPAVDFNKVWKEIAKRLKKISLTSVLVVALIVAAYWVGSLRAEVKYLKADGGGTRVAANAQAAAAPEAVAPNALGAQPAGDVEPVNDEDHIRGNRDAKVFLIEYSDLECPFCKSFHPTMERVLSEYGNDVAWVYRHFPLDQIHSKADKQAEAVECAGKLGGNDGFWNMVDKIFEVTPSNNGLDNSTLPDLAESVGINKSAFTTCLDSGEFAQHVEDDYQAGTKAGVTGTPTTFILSQNGEATMIPGALPYEQVKASVDAALAN